MIDEIKAKQKMIDALHEKKYDVVKVLMEIGTDLHYINDRTPFLYLICKEGDAELIRFAVSCHNVLLGETLMYAYTVSDFEVIEKLLSAGVAIDAKAYIGNTLLHKAAKNGDIKTVKYLLSKGANASQKNEIGYTALDYAGNAGHLEVVELLETAIRG